MKTQIYKSVNSEMLLEVTAETKTYLIGKVIKESKNFPKGTFSRFWSKEDFKLLNKK
jgi:hypothetical protein